MARRAIRFAEVEHLVALRRTKIYELVAAGDFPAPIKLTPTTTAFFEDEVVAWLEKRKVEGAPDFEAARKERRRRKLVGKTHRPRPPPGSPRTAGSAGHQEDAGGA